MRAIAAAEATAAAAPSFVVTAAGIAAVAGVGGTTPREHAQVVHGAIIELLGGWHRRAGIAEVVADADLVVTR